MARSHTDSSANTVMRLGLAGLILAIGGEMALHGAFGAAAADAVQSVVQTLGIRGSVGRQPTTAAAAGSSPTRRDAGACSTAFVPGRQYVARKADGTFDVVVNGFLLANYADQSTAETAYNHAVCPSS